MDRDLTGLILTGTERKVFDAQNARAGLEWLTMVFCAKEAFYKTQFPISRTFLDFLDVSVEITEDEFSVMLERPVTRLGDTGDRYNGRYAL